MQDQQQWPMANNSIGHKWKFDGDGTSRAAEDSPADTESLNATALNLIKRY